MYEAQETGRRFIPGLPVYARIDGKCFSNFTKGMNRPYDLSMVYAMQETTKYLVKETHAVIGYTQSDEISLAWYTGSVDSQIFFDGKIQKMASVLASMATVAFAKACISQDDMKDRWQQKMPAFDCRIFQLPSKMECANAFLWREQDAAKNSVSMAARHFFSHKQLEGKNTKEMQEMMWQEHVVNWNNYPSFFKRGTFMQRKARMVDIPEEELMKIPEDYRPENGRAMRTVIEELEMPKFSTVLNRVEVIFDSAEPLTQWPESA